MPPLPCRQAEGYMDGAVQSLMGKNFADKDESEVGVLRYQLLHSQL